MKNQLLSITITIGIITASIAGNGQISTSQLSGKVNTITTAVPFLMITPDTRAGGMGDAGVAASPDANSIHWNASKLAFAEKKMGFSISYTPWLKALVPDINLAYLSGYYKMKKDQAIGGSLRYFSLGNIQFTDIVGNATGQFKPNEFALDIAYSRKLGEHWSGGMALRYINSNLTGGITVAGATTHAGRSVAADISAFYNNKDIEVSGRKSVASFGVNISNIGAKISYSNKKDRDFIPINLRLGGALMMHLDEYNQVSFLGDINKLLVPSPPVYAVDGAGQAIYNSQGTQLIWAGKNPDRGIAEGMISSFYDAPGEPVLNNGKYVYLTNDSTSIEIKKGSVLKEELKEINFSAGFEYWYDKQFAFRFGYFNEAKTKGNRKFFTVGAGLKYNVFGLDFAYLIPTVQRHPLANTLRFTMTFDFEAFNAQNKEEPITE